MKTSHKNLAAFTLVMILLPVFWNCTNPESEVSESPVTGLAIYRDTQDVTDGTIALEQGEEVTLTAVLSPDGVTGLVTWTSDDEAVTVAPETGGTVTVTGVTGGGSATITASAVNDATPGPVTARITITVQGDGSDDPTPITGLIIMKGEAPVTGPVAIDVNEEITLTAVLSPDGVTGLVTWTSDDEAVTVAPETGGTVTVTGLTGGGSATITASAVNAGTPVAVAANVTVTVNVPPDLNILFQWNAADTPWESLAFGGSSVRTYPSYPDVHIRAFGAAIPAGNGGGIKLGAAGTASAGRLAVGLAGNTATDTATTVAGDFDLSEKLVKLTVSYTDLVSYASRYVFRVYVNNNGTGAAASLLGSASQIISLNGPTGGAPNLTETSGTIEVLIDPSAFESNPNKAALEHAFIGFHCQQANTAGENNFITITGIKIEYLPAGQAGITVENPWEEPAFTGFPAEAFTLSKSGSGGYQAAKTITLSGYTQAAWYLDGEAVESTELTYTVNAAALAKKAHSLTVVITKNGNLYSKTVAFTVVE
ncbi:MAG: hypothetical protein LBQ14_09540 [Treponema sp.]|jgi:hypothetical protein|nr:hypothetical protein [Treponema sp.]